MTTYFQYNHALSLALSSLRYHFQCYIHLLLNNHETNFKLIVNEPLLTLFYHLLLILLIINIIAAHAII